MTEKEFILVLKQVVNRLYYDKKLNPSLEETLDLTNEDSSRIPPVHSMSVNILGAKNINKLKYMVQFLFKSKRSNSEYHKIQILNRKLHDICHRNGDILFSRGRTAIAWNIAVYDYYKKLSQGNSRQNENPYINWFNEKNIDINKTFSITGLLRGLYNDVFYNYKLKKSKDCNKLVFIGISTEKTYKIIKISRFEEMGIENVKHYEHLTSCLELLNNLSQDNDSEIIAKGRFLICINKEDLSKDIALHNNHKLSILEKILPDYIEMIKNFIKIDELSKSNQPRKTDPLVKEIERIDTILKNYLLWSFERNIDLQIPLELKEAQRIVSPSDLINENQKDENILRHLFGRSGPDLSDNTILNAENQRPDIIKLEELINNKTQAHRNDKYLHKFLYYNLKDERKIAIDYLGKNGPKSYPDIMDYIEQNSPKDTFTTYNSMSKLFNTSNYSRYFYFFELDRPKRGYYKLKRPHNEYKGWSKILLN